MAYSVDLRVKVLEYIKNGNDRKEASRIFGVSLRSIARWLKMDKQGSVQDPKPKRPWKKIDPKELLMQVEAHPEYKLEDFARIFQVKAPSIFNAFKVLKITRKKRVIYTENEAKRSASYIWTRLPNTIKRS